MLLSCEEKQTNEAPTKPWLRDEAKQSKDKSPVRIRFQVAPESSLSVALPTRKSRPVGTLSGVDGYVDFDLKDLVQTSGRIHVDLPSLQMVNLPPPSKAEAIGHAPELYNDATGEALRWLGLGAGVSQKDRKDNSVGAFQFDSLRSLSHPSAHVGALRRSKTGGAVRQIIATAEGELSLRGFSVSRSFATTLQFHFPSTDAKLPDSVEITIGKGAVVPLAEYEIAPRGPSGNLDAQKSGLLGDLVGRDVHVTGSLFLSRVGAATEAQKSKIPE